MIIAAGSLDRREPDTPMDTDGERDHKFFGLMMLLDTTQLDDAYAYTNAQTDPG